MTDEGRLSDIIDGIAEAGDLPAAQVEMDRAARASRCSPTWWAT